MLEVGPRGGMIMYLQPPPTRPKPVLNSSTNSNPDPNLHLCSIPLQNIPNSLIITPTSDERLGFEMSCHPWPQPYSDPNSNLFNSYSKNSKLNDINPKINVVLGMSCKPQPQTKYEPDPNLHLCSTPLLKIPNLLSLVWVANPNLNLTPTPTFTCAQQLLEKFQIS